MAAVVAETACTAERPVAARSSPPTLTHLTSPIPPRALSVAAPRGDRGGEERTTRANLPTQTATTARNRS